MNGQCVLQEVGRGCSALREVTLIDDYLLALRQNLESLWSISTKHPLGKHLQKSSPYATAETDKWSLHSLIRWFQLPCDFPLWMLSAWFLKHGELLCHLSHRMLHGMPDNSQPQIFYQQPRAHKGGSPQVSTVSDIDMVGVSSYLFFSGYVISVPLVFSCDRIGAITSSKCTRAEKLCHAPKASTLSSVSPGHTPSTQNCSIKEHSRHKGERADWEGTFLPVLYLTTTGAHWARLPLWHHKHTSE